MMSKQSSHTSEKELVDVVLIILAKSPKRQASFAELIKKIPRYITLTPADLAPSSTRRNEAMWERRLKNIPLYKNAEGNCIFEGLLKGIPGGLALP